MKVLLGTTNPSKAKRFQDLLEGYDVEFYTLNDLKINVEPFETGKNPVENAVIKAKFYGQFYDRVICNDSGLYFLDLPMDDPRQPGLQIRRPKGRRLDDDHMLAYYAALVRTLGGKVRSNYLDGLAVYNQGEIFTMLDDGEDTAFYMVDAVHPKRHPGWPLDSISVEIDSGRYFVDPEPKKENPKDLGKEYSTYDCRLRDFLAESLKLERRP